MLSAGSTFGSIDAADFGATSARRPPKRSIWPRAAAFCREQGVDIAKLAVQFSVAHRDIPTTLVGTANPANIEKNVRWVEEPLDEALLAEVQRILAPIHNWTWPSGKAENN